MLIHQGHDAHKSKDDRSHTPFPQPKWVRFCGYHTIGEYLPFDRIGGDDANLCGWGGIMAMLDESGFCAVRSPDGLTVNLYPRLTNAQTWGHA